MFNIIYKNFIANVKYDKDIDYYMGEVINTESPITFYSRNKNNLLQEFKTSVEIWLEACKERGLNVRVY